MKNRTVITQSLVLALGVLIGLLITLAINRQQPRIKLPATKSTVAQTPRSRVNVPTRRISQYKQVGLLYSSASDIQPLYGRPTYRGSNRWNYFLITDSGNIVVNIPLSIEERDCSERNGCRELYDDDKVFVPELNKMFEVRLYKNTVRYIPSLP